MGRGAAGISGLRTLGHYWEFAVLRNLRVVRAKAQGVAMHALAQRGLLKNRARSSVYGVKLAANYGDKTFRYCLYGTYGTHLSRVLEGQDAPFVFVDIGAKAEVFKNLRLVVVFINDFTLIGNPVGVLKSLHHFTGMSRTFAT